MDDVEYDGGLPPELTDEDKEIHAPCRAFAKWSREDERARIVGIIERRKEACQKNEELYWEKGYPRQHAHWAAKRLICESLLAEVKGE
jgi:hypothetical protein